MSDNHWKRFGRRGVLAGLASVGALGVPSAGQATLGQRDSAVQGTVADVDLISNWPMFQADAANTGYYDELLGPTTRVDEHWSYDIIGIEARSTPVVSSPAVENETVFVGGRDFRLYAIDAATGDHQWHYRASGGITSSPTVVDGTAYFGSNDSNIYAVDAETGEERWRFGTLHWVLGSPTVVEGTVYIGSVDSYFYAIDARTGEEQWRFDADDWIRATAAYHDGTVLVHTLGGELIALGADTGAELWRFETANTLDDLDTITYAGNAPTVWDGTVYVGSTDGTFYAIDPTSGELNWQIETGVPIHSSPAVGDYRAYIGNVDGTLYSVNINSQSSEWTHDFDTAVSTSPAVVNDIIYLGAGQAIYAIDAETGDELWTHETDGVVRSSPAVVGGLVFAGSDDERVYALGNSQIEAAKTAIRQLDRRINEVEGTQVDTTAAKDLLNGANQAYRNQRYDIAVRLADRGDRSIRTGLLIIELQNDLTEARDNGTDAPRVEQHLTQAREAHQEREYQRVERLVSEATEALETKIVFTNFAQQVSNAGVNASYTRTHLETARIAYNDGEYDRARSISQRGMEALPTETRVRELGAELRTQRQNGFELPPITALHSRAESALENGDYDHADSLVTEARDSMAIAKETERTIHAAEASNSFEVALAPAAALLGRDGLLQRARSAYEEAEYERAQSLASRAKQREDFAIPTTIGGVLLGGAAVFETGSRLRERIESSIRETDESDGDEG